MSGRLIRPRIFLGLERNLTQYQPHGVEGGGGRLQLYSVLPTNRLMGMCSWMGLHFHNWGLILKRDPVTFRVRRRILKSKPVE